MWAGLSAKSVYIDSNILILAIEPGNRWTSMLQELFAAFDAGEVRPTTSEMTLAEVLAKPLELDAASLVQQYRDILDGTSAIDVVPIDRSILRLAAQFQSLVEIKLIDAIHVATASTTSCDFFLTNDIRLGRKLKQPRWLSLGDLARDQNG